MDRRAHEISIQSHTVEWIGSDVPAESTHKIMPSGGQDRKNTY